MGEGGVSQGSNPLSEKSSQDPSHKPPRPPSPSSLLLFLPALVKMGVTYERQIWSSA